MEKLPSYYRLIKSYEGKGSIHLSDGRKLDCDFECGQNEEGDIIVGLSTDPSGYAVIESSFDDSNVKYHVSGNTSTGQFLEANISVWTHFTLGSERASVFLIGYARDLAVGKEPAVPLNALKSYLVNFEFILPLSFRFRGFDITIKEIDGYEESKREMNATKRPKMTAQLTVTSSNNQVINVSEVQQILHDICLLLSLAKGCRIQWLYWDAYSADEKQVRSYHWNGWSSPFGDWFIVLENPPEDMREYLSQVLEPYQDVQKEGIWRFDLAITHFVDTISSRNMLELKATNLVVLTDYLTQLFAKHKEMNYFIERGSFADKKECLQDAVRKVLKHVFSAQDWIENEYMLEKKKGVKKPKKKNEIDNIILDQTIQEASDVIDCLNSRSFKSLLKRLLKNYLKVEIDEEELKLFVEIRNKLVHEASFLKEADFIDMKISPESNLKQFYRILSLTSRIMLAILNYRGYYHDWLKFKPGEWAGRGVSGRVKIQYLEGG